MNDFILNLIDYLSNRERVFIQIHNFPDHDAVASAFGLQQLLGRFKVGASLVYDKDIQRESLKKMIRELGIEVTSIRGVEIRASDPIVLVDGCKGNSNVTDLIGDEVAVIDHHPVEHPENVPFIDIRPEYGACATIIGSYYHDLEQPIARNVASALMLGINMDTLGLTRKVTSHDLAVYAFCFERADVSYVNSMVRNAIELKDLEQYQYLMKHVEYHGRIAFCFFPDNCPPNLLAMLGDFLLMLNEIDFVMLCAKNGQIVNCSCRSEVVNWDASRILQLLMEGLGSGGGHPDMAGGTIPEAHRFDAALMWHRLQALLKKL